MHTHSTMRSITTLGLGAVLAVLLTACGGGADSAPSDATQDEFCEAVLAQPEGFDSDDDNEAADAAHEYADKLRGVGTPEGISDDAREGFEIYVDFLADVEASDAQRLEDAEPGDIFSEDELTKFEAFSQVTADCGPGEFETE